MRAGVPLLGTPDHGVSEALYLNDPGGTGAERYWDKPQERWPRTPSGDLNMDTESLDLAPLFSELR